MFVDNLAFYLLIFARWNLLMAIVPKLCDSCPSALNEGQECALWERLTNVEAPRPSQTPSLAAGKPCRWRHPHLPCIEESHVQNNVKLLANVKLMSIE